MYIYSVLFLNNSQLHFSLLFTCIIHFVRKTWDVILDRKRHYLALKVTYVVI